ncbi:MAG: hypothetical protein JJE07_04580 [Flavobacteriaceae bacterium]|nr:hypothetical protein [Flavobacteriaceae bacterium]
MRKALLVLVIGMCLTTNLHSQSRETPQETLEIGEFTSWVKGDDVSGWDFHNEKWKSRKGYLRVGDDAAFIDINEKYDKPIGESKSRTDQNFDEIGVLSMVYEGNNYIGLGIEKQSGRYRYPAIKEDWIYDNVYYVFVFSKEEINKLNTIDGTIELKPTVGAIGKRLEKEKKYQSCSGDIKYCMPLVDGELTCTQYKLVINKTTDGDNDVIRFLIPQKVRDYGKPNFVDFPNHYFEVSLVKFNELLELINE